MARSKVGASEVDVSQPGKATEDHGAIDQLDPLRPIDGRHDGGAHKMNAEIREWNPPFGQRRPRAQDIDRHIGARLRRQRVLNGLTQQKMADLIGVTYQQAHKYESGVNRIAAGRLYVIAQVLGVDVGYFFEGLESAAPSEPNVQQRVFLDLARNFRSIRARKHQEAICLLTRILANLEHASETDDPWEAVPLLAESA
jgi:transcriptional regulator with XRE-family HTH domain